MRGKRTDYVKARDRVKLSAGDVIRVACEMLEMSQAKLARRTGIAPSHISAIIAGKKSIGKVVASKLAKALQISPGQILFAGDKPRVGSHAVEALEKNAQALREQNRELKTLLKGSMRLAKSMSKSTPKMRELMLKLEQASEINEEEDITGFYVLAKRALDDSKGHHKG